MKEKRIFYYLDNMGNMWKVLGKNLPACVVEIVKEFWLVYYVDDFACLSSFQLFRASWRGAEITIKQNDSGIYSVKIVY